MTNEGTSIRPAAGRGILAVVRHLEHALIEVIHTYPPTSAVSDKASRKPLSWNRAKPSLNACLYAFQSVFDSRVDVVIEMLHERCLNVAVYSDFYIVKRWMLTNCSNFHCHRCDSLTRFLCTIPTSLCFVAVDLICVTDVLHNELQGISGVLRRQVCAVSLPEINFLQVFLTLPTMVQRIDL